MHIEEMADPLREPSTEWTVANSRVDQQGNILLFLALHGFIEFAALLPGHRAIGVTVD